MPRVNPRKDVFNKLIANPSCVALAKEVGCCGGTEVEFETDEQKEWKDRWYGKVIHYTVKYNNECPLISKKVMKRALNIAMTTWSIEIPIKIKSLYRNINNADIIISFSKAKDDQYFNERPGVLAYAYFPATSKAGEIVFNTDYIWATHSRGILGSEAVKLGLIDQAVPTNKLVTWNIIHTLIHEIGHSLGLRHDSDGNSRDVMDPYYDGKVLDLSERDLYRIRLKYGVRNWNSWTKYNIIKKWLLKRVRRI